MPRWGSSVILLPKQASRFGREEGGILMDSLRVVLLSLVGGCGGH